MERYRAVIRVCAGRLKEWARGRLGLLWVRIKEWMGEMTPRRVLAAVVALSLWMGAGCMTASVAERPPSGVVFGEVHWYEG